MIMFATRKCLVGASLTAALLAAPLAHADLTGNIGAYSKYVFRGLTNNAENDTTAVQGGFDYSHASGVYAGYWGSNLDYGSAPTVTGFENDIYAGYKFKAGAMSLNIGGLYYLYTQVDDSDVLEGVFGLGVGPVTFGAKYLFDDVVWGNQGDIYLTADYSQPLPQDFTLGASLGFYIYDDSDPGTAGTIAPGTTTESSAFRHLNLTLSHPVANKAATLGATYIIGGKDRSGIDQKDAVVLNLSTTF